MTLVVIMILVGAFMYLTASGDPGKAQKARTIIIFAVIGAVIAALAKLLPSVALSLVGV